MNSWNGHTIGAPLPFLIFEKIQTLSCKSNYFISKDLNGQDNKRVLINYLLANHFVSQMPVLSPKRNPLLVAKTKLVIVQFVLLHIHFPLLTL